LTEAKALAGYGNWLPWLEREFGWTDKTAENFMSIFKASGKFENFSNIDLPISSLYLLAAPNTPPKAVEIVIERVKTGEKVTGAEVKKIVHEAKSKSSPRPPDSGTKKRGSAPQNRPFTPSTATHSRFRTASTQSGNSAHRDSLGNVILAEFRSPAR
jgi:hypothetical protein